MNKIKDYKIIQSTGTVSLENELKPYWEEGWQPLGDLKIELDPKRSLAGFSFFQVIVKYEKIESNQHHEK